jgi:hypothetical protein
MSDTERGVLTLIALIVLFAGLFAFTVRYAPGGSIRSTLRGLGEFILFMVGWAFVGSLPGIIACGLHGPGSLHKSGLSCLA